MVVLKVKNTIYSSKNISNRVRNHPRYYLICKDYEKLLIDYFQHDILLERLVLGTMNLQRNPRNTLRQT